MTSAPMLVLFTDFGLAGPYMGQMRAALHRDAPGLVIVDLFADAPSFDIRAAAYLLAAYAPDFPAGAVFVCVVDPGVGGKRPAMVLRAEGRAGRSSSAPEMACLKLSPAAPRPSRPNALLGGLNGYRHRSMAGTSLHPPPPRSLGAMPLRASPWRILTGAIRIGPMTYAR